jgi:hypothetical protein
MLVQNWGEFATILAAYARQHLPSVYRGAMLIPCPAENQIFAVVFGNESEAVGEVKEREVEALRERLARDPFEELGYGLSPDGATWVMLIQAPYHAYQTVLGQEFQKELLRAHLEDAVWGTGLPLCEISAAEVLRSP